MCGNSLLGSKRYEEGKICGRRRVKDGGKDFNTGRSFFFSLGEGEGKKRQFCHKYYTPQC